MPRALITGLLSRPDLLRLFDECRGHVEMAFIEYAFNWSVRTNEEHYRPYGEVRHWSDFENVDAVLDAFSPDLVVLLYNSSLNQILLKLAAQRRGIRTCHLEHGLRAGFGPQTYASYGGVLE